MSLSNYSFSMHDLESTFRVYQLLLTDLSRKYTIPELARWAGVNANKLQHCFKQLFGHTIFDFHQGSRLEYAKHLLRSTQDTVQVIAEACGYAENANFTNAFKKRYGCTPDHYRRSREGDPFSNCCESIEFPV